MSRRASWKRFRRSVSANLRSGLECKDEQRQFIQIHQWSERGAARTTEETHVQLIVDQIVVSIKAIIRSCVVDADAVEDQRQTIDQLTDMLVEAYKAELRLFFTQAADRGGTLRKAYGAGSQKTSLARFEAYFKGLTVDELTGAFVHVTKSVVKQAFPDDGWDVPPPPGGGPPDDDDEKKDEDDKRRMNLLDRARLRKRQALALAASVRPREAGGHGAPPRRAAAVVSQAKSKQILEDERKYEEEEAEEDQRLGKKPTKTKKKKKSQEEKEDEQSRRAFEVQDQHYVYLLMDVEHRDKTRPLSLNEKAFRDSVFYVGQGVGGRFYDHLKIGNPNVAQNQTMKKDLDKLKTKIIQRLWNARRGPRIAVVYGGLTKQEADTIEGCLVHTQGLFSRLENIASGHLTAAGLTGHDAIVQRCGLLLGQGAHDFVSHYLSVGGLQEHTNEQGV
jgi:hypothetical protein